MLSELGPFCKYDRNGVDAVIEFTTGSWAERPKLKAMAQLTKHDDQQVSFNFSRLSSPRSPSPLPRPVRRVPARARSQEKLEDFRDPSARFFVVSAREGGALLGFAHVRFTLQGEARGSPTVATPAWEPAALGACSARMREALTPDP